MNPILLLSQSRVIGLTTIGCSWIFAHRRPVVISSATRLVLQHEETAENRQRCEPGTYAHHPFDDWDELSMIPFDRPIPEWLRLPTDDPDWMPEHWKSHNSKKTTE